MFLSCSVGRAADTSGGLMALLFGRVDSDRVHTARNVNTSARLKVCLKEPHSSLVLISSESLNQSMCLSKIHKQRGYL